MRPFITGATGLVGSHLVAEFLRRGVEPVCLVRDSMPTSLYETMGLREKCITVSGDLDDVRSLERIMVEHEVDTVFHLAAQTIVRYGHQGPLSTFEANIRGSWNVLEAARRKSRFPRVVVASSDKAYGKHAPPYVEWMALRGSYPYDVSKSCMDLISASYFETYSLPITIVRCSNLYGPGDLNWSRIVPRTVRFSVKRDVDLELRGGGLMKRDYLHVKDAVSGYLLAAEKKEAIGNAYNFGTGSPVETSFVVDRILTMLNHDGPPPVKTSNGENEITHQWMNTLKAEVELGWHPSRTLEQGLVETVAWYQEYFKVQVS